MSIMRRPLLSTFAVMSLVALAVLLLGCFASFGTRCLRNVVGSPHPHATAITLQLDRGRVAIYWDHWNKPLARVPSGTHIDWRWLRFGGPDLR